MYLVVWTTRPGDDGITDSDHYETCETLEEARAQYADVIERDDTWSASIAMVVESTDYSRAANTQTEPLA